MSTGLKANSDGSAAIQVGGSDAIQLSTGLAATFVNNVSVAGNLTVTGNTNITGTLTATNGITGSLKSGTAVASTSGTSIDFTGLPTGIKRITVMFQGVSTNGTSIIQVQLGDSGGVETTGYLTSVWQSNTNNSNVTTGFALGAGALAVNTLSGHVVFTLLGSNTWIGSGVIGRTDAADSRILGGNKTLSDVLDRVRITTVNGTDTFDAGTINILYE
jgi:hypothetical protein